MLDTLIRYYFRRCRVEFDANLSPALQVPQQEAAATGEIDNHIFFLDRLLEFVGVGPAAKSADILLPIKITFVIVVASRRSCFCVNPSVLSKLQMPRQ
ncbi:MAG: hypothetical protein H7293_01380 [Candidatus Saccharibacteria bacterium]|nr:hypothetical protein [Rhodoferax sp.]